MDPRTVSQDASIPDGETPRPWNGDYGFGSGDRRLAFSRQASLRQPDPWTPRPAERKDSARPYLARSASCISIPPDVCSQLDGENAGKSYGKYPAGEDRRGHQNSYRHLVLTVFRAIRSGNKPMKRLSLMIFLNVAYSTAELAIGIFSGRVGLVSDAFHLTFGCSLLTFSLFAMAASRRKPDRVYTYGYKRLEVLSAFTNAAALSFIYVILLSCGSTSCFCPR